MNKNFVFFIARWLVNSLGLWTAVRLLGVGHDNIPVGASITGFLMAGLAFSIINSMLRPLVVVLALPAIVMTLGLFMIIINGLMVYVSLKVTPSIDMTFLNSIYTGLVLSLVNYILDVTVTARANKIK